ncbi:class I SAM-dependent methyltransferase [Rhodanobacter aciditrophus]|uniref:class I SAM-dependent methyltransferase n=1 Tax=Rhodanobacter aciditrophus TaxID=1623218 RepID=UPI003CF5A089
MLAREATDPLLLDRVARRAIARRYAGRFYRGYAQGKLAGDPVYAAVAGMLAAAPPRPLLDIGCGLGLLGQYLHECGLLHGYLGVDFHDRRVAAGRAAGARLSPPLELRCGDAAQLPAFQGHVALLDMLHYLPAPRQAALLHEAATRLAPDGLLLIRNVLREANWRFHATRAEEWFLRVSGQMRVGAQHYPDANEIRAPLAALGLTVTVQPLYGHTPFNSYLIVARHPS